MDCPRGHGPLTIEHHQGIEVDRCPECNGRWLDYHELEQLEAKAAPDPDTRKGMIEYARRQSELSCPVCGTRMTSFNYRANPLELDTCEAEHGYWLDAGEESRVQDLIEQRVRDLYRASSAEESWGNFVKGLMGGKGRFGRRR